MRIAGNFRVPLAEFVNAARLADIHNRSCRKVRRFPRCRHQARAVFWAALITVFFVRFSPAGKH